MFAAPEKTDSTDEVRDAMALRRNEWMDGCDGEVVKECECGDGVNGCKSGCGSMTTVADA